MADDLAIQRLNWALLIDGENIGSGFAGEILALAAKHGALPIRRVYGDVEQLAGWTEVQGLRLVHAGTGKNATDLLLCIEAMEIFHSGQVEGIVLAASDRDYTHLALHLRERGFRLIVLGEEKTPEKLRHAAGDFAVLGRAVAQKPAPARAVAAQPKPRALDPSLRKVIEELKDKEGWAPIGLLGSLMWQRHQVRRADTGAASWGKYLAGRSDICQLDAAARPPRVRLRD
ncbi:NYN domain-containing protein [Phaeovulum sp.]|uniref:NYN domain-containing protein n=1 Tax=Phaeovulum sp. TaxID=2934796 RepID=UPI00356A532E